MRTYFLGAALVAAALPLSPAMARQSIGHIVRTTNIRSGPDSDYPTLRRLSRNAQVTVYGCLRDWSWCDIGYRNDRGWVAGRDMAISYRGTRRQIGSSMGVGILSFMFGTYWESHYRSRPFYGQRPRWEQHYTNNYQPAWGRNPQRQESMPNTRPVNSGQPHGDRQPTPQRPVNPPQHTPNWQRVAPPAATAVPQQRPTMTIRHQPTPMMQGMNQRDAAPGGGNSERGKPEGKRGNQQGADKSDRKRD